MENKEIVRYKELNKLAEADGIVIFGGSEDTNIPLGELKQAFSLKDNIYNRSFSSLTAADAAEIYNECVSELCPETVILHIGGSDLATFGKNSSEFDKNYATLIRTIRKTDAKRRIVIVSLQNYDNDAAVEEMNKHLKYISESEKCEFEDISAKRVMNVRETKEVASFIYDLGFDHALKAKRPLYDLVRILFCCQK